MINLKDMSPDDKSLYWRGCYVFDFVEKIPYVVKGYDGCFRVSSVLDGEESGVSNSRFANNFLHHRPTLGWRNVGPYCLYGYSYPGRSNRKALIAQELVVEFPLYNSLREVYANIRSQFFEGNLDLERDMRTLCEVMECMSPVATQRYQDLYIRNFFTDFIGKDEAVHSVLSGARASAAINSTWAVTITAELYNEAAAIMYDNREVGIITNDEVVFPDAQETLEAAWTRL